MSETQNTEKEGGKGGRKPLTLKRKVDAGTVRQSFSHGRTKTVVVEKKRRKTITQKGPAKKPVEAKADEPEKEEAAAAAPQSVSQEENQDASARNLTKEEIAARSKALEEAKVADAEAKRREAEEAERRAKEEAEAEARRKIEEEEQRLKAEEAEAKARQDTKKRKPAEEKESSEKSAHEAKPAKKSDTGKKAHREEETSKPISSRKGERKRREGKLTINNASVYEDEERSRSLASVRRAREKEKKAAQARIGEQQKVLREVTVPETITVGDLANRMAESVKDVVRKLMENGQMLTKNDVLDADTAELIVGEFGHVIKRVSEADVEIGLAGTEDVDAELQPRAPVITIMGHVDHGKTSLLDALRETNVVSGEAGGITQHIGAYQVTVDDGKKITFLDTPGHAAFTAMRARGASVTDIVVLVVAADDGIMPQSIEAINHAKAAEAPMIVAINKIDKPEANPDRVRQELLQHEVISEALGGETLDVEVSALQGTNLDKLLEAIQLQAELLDLRANPDRSGDGTIIESKLDKGRGPVATALIQRGSLAVGDIMVAGEQWGKVRALVNDRGESVDKAGPSVPVEVLGLDGTPQPGDDFAIVESEARAREVTEFRSRKAKEAKAVKTQRGSLEQMMSQLKETELSELPIVIKADVQGSAEAITSALEKMSTEEVAARILLSGVGGITESDVILASASNAPVIGFNVRANKQAREHAAREGIEIRYYSVIYDVIDDIKAAMSGMLSPTLREEFLGNAEILEVFNISKVGRVAGCRVTEGKVKRGAKVRLIRDSVVIHEGSLGTLKRFKDEVREVDSGQECGMGFENYQDIQPGDVIECFDVEEVARTLE